MNDATVTRSCSRCGKPIALDAPEGLCVSCLFVAGTETLTNRTQDDATMASVDAAALEGASARFEPGDTYGPYRLGRLLGRGGMGEVYEAEQLETGRRVALKVLRGRLQDAGDRARFLREGQLAASVSHPHTVYVFGSDEIAGMPVISMELLPGGTLKDRVSAGGPLPSTTAVAAVLDIIGGLDAAQAAGILHRDIKPSNIFTDAEGGIKVGDFGLSISTLARGVVREGDGEGFQGTPQFAPPEQLRGEPLDVRADIYAVGATLYYLLTGHPPFDAPDLKTLFSRVLSETPASPRALRGDVPPGLAAVVLRCLAKAPEERFASYAALADALRPFAATDRVPAAPAIRIVAGVIDSMILSAVAGLSVLYDFNLFTPGPTSAFRFGTVLISFLYYSTLEGVWGASLGKRLFGLKVTSADGGAMSWQAQGAPWPRIAVRTLLFLYPGVVLALVVHYGGLGGQSPDFTQGQIQTFLGFALMGLLFVTARRANGWAGLHDLWTGTRVVTRAKQIERSPRTGPQVQPLAGTKSTRGGQFGPFAVVADVGANVEGHLFVGFDPILERQVWIRTVPPGTPPMSDARRDVSRIGRLHWLTGHRSSSSNLANLPHLTNPASQDWDAFEAPDGTPIAGRNEVVSWPVLKVWLQDLATELSASVQDGSLPRLRINHLWQRTDGHLVVLDFPAPGTPSTTEQLSPVDLLAALVRECEDRLRNNERQPIPLGARVLLKEWSVTPPPDLVRAQEAITHAGRSAESVSTVRRAMPFLLTAFPVLLMAAVSVLVTSAVTTMTTGSNQEMFGWLDALNNPRPESRLHDPAIRQAAEQYVAGRWSEPLKQMQTGQPPATATGVLREDMLLGADISRRYPSVSADDLARVTTVLAPEIERAAARRRADVQRPTNMAGIIGGVLIALPLILTFILGVVSSLAVPGGFVMRTVGLAVIDPQGHEISRGRSLVRVLVAWTPALVWLAWLATSPKIQGFVPNPGRPLTGIAIFLACVGAGAAWLLVRPTRAPHDWVAGTTVIPR